jgi:cytochrome c oxidase cbb3-type subunit 3
MRPGAVIVVFALVASIGACEREARRLQQDTPPAKTDTSQKQGENQPGAPGTGLPTTASGSFNDRNAFEVANGKRLFRWYNCSGCHGAGGGGMGPALMDDKWLYGAEPDNIFKTIMDGRPNGMPAFRGRIPEQQAWQLVAYVRSMSGLVAKDVAPSRSDSANAGKSENRRGEEKPRPDPAK